MFWKILRFFFYVFEQEHHETKNGHIIVEEYQLKVSKNNSPNLISGYLWVGGC